MNQELWRAGKAATLGECLAQWARLQPEAAALVWLDDGELARARWTYAQLDRETRKVMAALRAHDVVGQPVLLVFPPGLDFVAAFCGCLAAGAIAVPVPFLAGRRGAARLAAITADVQPVAMLTTQAAAGLIDIGLAALALRDVPAIAIDRLVDPGDSGRGVVQPSAPALLQYTSGSTSEPKGIAITHAALMANLEMMRLAGGVDRDSIYVSWLPLFHDMGLIGVVLEALYAGAHAVLMSPLAFLQRPTRWLQAIAIHRATHSGAPNFAFDLCCRRFRPDAQPALDLSSWRMAFCGAEPISAETLQRFADRFAPCGFDRRALYPTYGLAEATVFVSGGELGAGLRTLATEPSEDGRRSLAVNCGRGWLDQTIAIVDPETARELPEGATGEIWVAGSNIAAGYWRNGEATRAAFGATLAEWPGRAFLRTGDLGLKSGGDLHVVGRLKELLIHNGTVLHPQDIEAAVAASHPSFAPTGAAFAVDTPGGQQIVAVHEIALAALGALDHSDAVAAAFTSVGHSIGVRLWDLVPVRPGTIPLTTSGKVRRTACGELYRRGALARGQMPGDHRWLGKHRP
ncbi:MAG TPA: fatty acyl-AMP ligase [Xanthobacteraceae bacterium]|nr:fatty acyl-AMP ligase [Xanthobacteraceae bacterium]